MKIKYTQIRATIDRLGHFPFSARVAGRIGVRIKPVSRYPYLVFYAVDPAANELQILSVRHSAQDPGKHLE